MTTQTETTPVNELLQAVTTSLVEAGFGIHDCAARARSGGACLTPASAEPGVIVTWATHDALALDPDRFIEDRDVRNVMNFVLGDVLTTLGWDVRDVGQAGASIIVGRHPQGTDGGEDQ